MSQSIGSVEFGRVFHFSVSNRDSAGADHGWTPAFFDVFDNSSGALILSNQELARETDRDLWYGAIDTGQGATDAAAEFALGTYSLVVKPSTAEAPATFAHYNFTVTGANSARLQRILGLLGENLVLDNFGFDTAGNCVSYRVRIFQDRFSAENASIGITDTPEPGEVMTYTVAQSYSSGRLLRASHVSLPANDVHEE